MVVVFSTFFTHIQDEHTHTHTHPIYLTDYRVEVYVKSQESKNTGRRQKKLQIDSIFDFTTSWRKFSGANMFCFLFRFWLHGPSFRVFFNLNENCESRPLLQFFSFFERHKTTANIACDINEGKRIKSNQSPVCFKGLKLCDLQKSWS